MLSVKFKITSTKLFLLNFLFNTKIERKFTFSILAKPCLFPQLYYFFACHLPWSRVYVTHWTWKISHLLAKILENYEQRLREWETSSSTTNPVNIKLAKVQIYHIEIRHVYHTRTSWFLFWTQKKEQQVLCSTSTAISKTTSAACWWALKQFHLVQGGSHFPCICRTKGKAEKEAVSFMPSFFRLSCPAISASSQRLYFKDLSLKFIFKFWRLISMKAGIVK